MKLLSFRANWSSELFVGEPLYRDDSGQVYGDGASAVDRLGGDVKGKRILFLIHGYNVNYAGVIAAYCEVEANLRKYRLLGPEAKYQDLVGVLWPGHTALGFAPAIYSANRTGDRLAAVLAQLRGCRITLETHSLGARVALQAARVLRLEQLILTSPAVSDTCFEPGREFSSQYARSVDVCYSQNDPVLGVWYRGFEWIAAAATLSSGSMALGLTGPADPRKCPPAIHAEDFSGYIRTHGGWASCAAFYRYWSSAAWL